RHRSTHWPPARDQRRLHRHRAARAEEAGAHVHRRAYCRTGRPPAQAPQTDTRRRTRGARGLPGVPRHDRRPRRTVRDAMSARPPRLAAWLIGRRVDAADREHALGDLDEEYAARAARHGRAAARRWYWRAALSEILPGRISTPRAPRKFYREEFRAALRALRRAPAASAAAILTYALGIGANIAIFSVAWPVLVAPLPFPDEQQLVDFWLTVDREGGGFGTNPISEGDYNDIRTASAFAATAAYSSRLAPLNLVTGTDPRQVAVAHVTPAFFTVLGVQPLQGRTFLPSDEDTNRNLLVLNARTWRTAFGADPGIIGRVVRIDN